MTEKELANRLSLKETWEFEQSDAGWDLLKKEFPELARVGQGSRDAHLENLPPPLRLKIDDRARRALIQNHPEWLQEAKKEKQSVAIPMKGKMSDFGHVEGQELLKSGIIYSPDSQSYYSIQVVEKLGDKEILTFEEALRENRLKSVEHPTLNLASFMEMARKKIVSGDLSPLKKSGSSLADQWALVLEKEEISRSREALFSLPEGEWSQLSSQNGDMAFYRLLQKKQPSKSLQETMAQGEKLLGKEAKQYFIHDTSRL
jgi:hypothetical protein